MHPTSSPDRNLSKTTGRYVENTNKKSSFFYDTYPQIYIKKCLRPIRYFNLKQFNWLTYDDMEFELELKGPFLVEISSNEPLSQNHQNISNFLHLLHWIYSGPRL